MGYYDKYDDSGGICTTSQLEMLIRNRISDGDYPPGTELKPQRLAPVLSTTSENLHAALLRLEAQSIVVQHQDLWKVSLHREEDIRELMAKARPLMLSILHLATARISDAEIDIMESCLPIMSCYDKYYPPEERMLAYAGLMNILIAASGSRFHIEASASMFKKASASLMHAFKRQGNSYIPKYMEGELARLITALKDRDRISAIAAIEDHFLIMGHVLDMREY